MHIPNHHDGHQAIPNTAPVQPPAATPVPVHLWSAVDSYTPTSTSAPAPVAAPEGGLVKLLGLSRFQHVMHFFQPVRALLSKARGTSRATAVGAHIHHAGAVVAGASAGQRFVQAMGGKLGLLSALVSVPIFWLDWRSAQSTLADTTAPDSAKRMTRIRLGLSGLSAAAGVGALAAAAIGLAFPPALGLIAPLATTSGLTGLGSFVASLFGRHDQHQQGHSAAPVHVSTVPTPPTPVSAPPNPEPTASWTLVTEQLGPLLQAHQEHLRELEPPTS